MTQATANTNAFWTASQTADGSSAAVTLDAAQCQNIIGVLVQGTFGGCSITLQVSVDGGTTYVDTTFVATAALLRNVELPYPCKFRLTIAGATGTTSVKGYWMIGA